MILEKGDHTLFWEPPGHNHHPSPPSLAEGISGFIGGFVVVMLLRYGSHMTNFLWFIPPFAASAMVSFEYWRSPIAQPKNIIGGHVLSSLVGLVALRILGTAPVALGLAVGTSIFLMTVLRFSHAPASSDPIIVMLNHASWVFLLTPVLAGAVTVAAFALFYNRYIRHKPYPVYWWDVKKPEGRPSGRKRVVS
ncbi:HPP family protein [Sulfobacillus thermosulfidooxidans]|uniref:HPP family protein n=1 Tax=Sulfobacillus thermosulfidooxidans TaxID=28034 RepID=UPI000429D597|nr:HPP family protein [Sulfobacillus thermosulfidooxidans]